MGRTGLISLRRALSSTVISLMDGFSTLNGDETLLWLPYTGEGNDTQVASIVGSEYRVQTGASPSNYYVMFMPRDGGYPYPTGYLHQFADANYADTMNRMVWIQRWSINRDRTVSKTDNIQFGTYIRNRAEPDAAVQGAHYYHYMNVQTAADKWRKIWMDDKPQTRRSAPGEYPPDPEYAAQGQHYYANMTIMYIDHQPLNEGWGDHRVDVAGFHLIQIDDEPTALISSVNGGYDGTKYDFGWCSPRTGAITYDIRYSTTSMKRGAGFLSGTDGGQVTSRGDAYVTCDWQSPVMAEANPGLFVAIRPVGEALYTEKYIPYNLGPHNYSDDGY
jgi:hypothetical protein